MNASRTARERARAELVTEIKAEARRQLASAGAAGLSLRAVARELGMVSSALYRYFPNRDELLTALIIDAYEDIGAAAEAGDAAVPRTHFRARWIATHDAVRRWALDHPHEYALIYGSPVVGYRAPRDTITPAQRAVNVLLTVITDSRAAGGTARLDRIAEPTPALTDQLRHVAEHVAVHLTPPEMAAMVGAWTHLFGMINFEMFGHYANTLEPADEYFHYAVIAAADTLGLHDTP